MTNVEKRAKEKGVAWSDSPDEEVASTPKSKNSKGNDSDDAAKSRKVFSPLAFYNRYYLSFLIEALLMLVPSTEIVRANTTIIMLHSGNCEIIGVPECSSHKFYMSS